MVLEMIVKLMFLYNSSRVDFVTDRYPDVSIKNSERSRRAATGYQRIEIFSGDQKTPRQWKKFFNCGSNKEALVEFLFKSWWNLDLGQVRLSKVRREPKELKLRSEGIEINEIKIGTHCVHVGSRKKDQLTKLVICDITLNTSFFPFMFAPPTNLTSEEF